MEGERLDKASRKVNRGVAEAEKHLSELEAFSEISFLYIDILFYFSRVSSSYSSNSFPSFYPYSSSLFFLIFLFHTAAALDYTWLRMQI